MHTDVNRAAPVHTGWLTTVLALGLLLGTAAVIRWYLPQYRQSGKVLLLADLAGPPSTAEPIDATGAAIARPFCVPSAAPIRLSAGPNRLRVSAPARLSAIWEIDVEPGTTTEIYLRPGKPMWREPVALSRRDPGEGLGQPPRPIFEILQLSGRRGRMADIVLNDPPTGVAADTGRTLWEGKRDWPVPGAPPPPIAVLPAVNRMRLLPTAPDLDGDGTGDLVWLFEPYPTEAAPQAWQAREMSPHPAVLAVSGRTGRPLWSFPASLPARSDLQPPLMYGSRGVYFGLEGAVVGIPVVLDVDGDGTADLLVTLASLSGGRSLAAISGRTGEPLWRFNPAPSLPDSEAEPEGPAQIVAWAHGTALVWQRDKQVFRLDVFTGRPLHPPVSLPCRPLRPPLFADLDGDGTAEAIVLSAEEPDHLALTAVSLATAEVMWRRVLHQAEWARVHGNKKQTPRGPYRESDPKYPLITDLDGDGRPELIVPQWTDLDSEGYSARMWLEVWEGASAQTRWRHDLVRWAWMPAQPPRLAVGPEVIGSGRQEVFALSAVKDIGVLGPCTARRWLYADALQPADGRPTWWRRFRLGEGLSPDRCYGGTQALAGSRCWWLRSRERVRGSRCGCWKATPAGCEQPWPACARRK
jgi:hypothetical protein